MIMWSKGAFLWDDRIRISDLRSLGSWRIKWTNESLSRVDSSVHVIYYDPSDLGSLILIRIISKERTLRLLNIVFLLSLPFGSFQNSVDSPNTLFTLLTTTYLSKLRTSRFFIVSIYCYFFCSLTWFVEYQHCLYLTKPLCSWATWLVSFWGDFYLTNSDANL